MNWRIGGIVAFWFLVGVIVYVIIKNWGVEYWWDPVTWQIVAAIATWLLAGGVVFVILQVRQARKSTNAQIALELFRELRSDKTLDQLRSIYALKPGDFKCLSSDKKKEIDYLFGKWELVGALAALKIIEEKLAIEPYGGPAAIRCWYVLHDYIKKVRDDRGYFCENFEGFARLCLDYFHNAGQKVKLQREGEEDKELVFVELQKPELKPRTYEEIERDRKKDKDKFEGAKPLHKTTFPLPLIKGKGDKGGWGRKNLSY